MGKVTRGYWLAGALLLAGGAVVTRAQAPERHVWTGVYTKDQAERGKAAYAENCAACHGDTLAGIDVAPALVGPTFLHNWNNPSAGDRKSTRLNSSHYCASRLPSSA